MFEDKKVDVKLFGTNIQKLLQKKTLNSCFIYPFEGVDFGVTSNKVSLPRATTTRIIAEHRLYQAKCDVEDNDVKDQPLQMLN